MFFRVLFYNCQLGNLAFIALFAMILGRVFAENVIGVEPGPIAENILEWVTGGIVVGLVAACGIGAISAIYLTVRGWQLACPFCGAASGLDITDKRHIILACPCCGDVGGRQLRDWKIKVYPPGNPTRDWSRTDGIPLVVDLEAGTFCGVRLGESIAPLQGLGPVEYAPGLRIGGYAYFSKGLEYGTEGDDLLQSYSVYDAHSDDPRFATFPGRLRHGGQLIALAEITPHRAIELFGQPIEKDEYDGILCLYFERPGIEFDLEFDAKGNFGTLSASQGPVQ